MFSNAVGMSIIKIGMLAVLVNFWTQLFSQDLNIGLPFIRNYSAEEYGAGIQNWFITQDKRGLIYVANNFGVLEYDGSRWIKYPVVNGTKVRHLAIGENGLIYVANQGDFGFLSPNPSGKLVYTSLADRLDKVYRNFDETWKVFVDDERIYFCTFKWLFIYEQEKLQVIEYSSPPEEFFFVNRELIVLQLDKGLFKLDNDELKLMNRGEFYREKPIASIIPWPDEKLLVVTRNSGIYEYDGFQSTAWNDNIDDLGGYDFNFASLLHNGQYAFGTENHGLIITDPQGNIKLHLNKDNGLNDRKVLCIYEDYNGNVWIGHNNGISHIALSLPFTLINEDVNLPGTGYVGFLDDGKLYLGTSNGLYMKDLNKPHPVEYELIDNSNGQVYEVKELDDILLMGHHEGGFRIVKDKAAQLNEQLGTWTFLPIKKKPGYMISGNYKGLSLYEKRSEGWVYLTDIEGFNESSRVIEEDNEGRIWMTHGYKGVFRLTLSSDLSKVDEVKFYGSRQGLPSNILINVYKIRGELIFSTEHEIYRYDAATDRFQKHPFYSDFFKSGAGISVLAQDIFENVYFIGQKSMGVLEKNSSGNYHLRTQAFNRIKNMMNDDLQNISILNGKDVLFGAKEGFILYKHEKSGEIKTEYNTLIRGVNLTNKDSLLFHGTFTEGNSITSHQPYGVSVDLPYKDNSIKFGYSTPFMHGYEITKYKYLLEGFDQVWSDWENETEKEYTNLPEGEYIFKVKGKNFAEVISSQAEFHFTILPPWYRTSTAYTSYGIAVLAFFFVSFKILDRKHKRETSKIKSRSSQMLNEKENELRLVTQKSEAEIEHLKNEKLQSEINHKNKELASSTMNLISKNEFISGIKSTLSSISKRSKNHELKNELNRLIKNIDKNISEDNDWEQFEFHFDQVHGEFSQKLHEKHPDLSPQEMKISTLLRMNLSTKEIANLLNISVRGVEISRYRLRKRLGLDRKTNLTEYLMNF